MIQAGWEGSDRDVPYPLLLWGMTQHKRAAEQNRIKGLVDPFPLAGQVGVCRLLGGEKA